MDNLVPDTTTKDQIERGEAQAPVGNTRSVVGAPRRSWKKGGEVGSYDFKFSYEEDGRPITVLCVYSKDVEGIKDARRSITQAGLDLKTRAEELAKQLQENPESITPEQLRQIEIDLRRDTSRLKQDSTALARELVEECVVGWRGAPIPFTAAARADLPDDICGEWMPQILDHHDLSDNDAAFLETA